MLLLLFTVNGSCIKLLAVIKYFLSPLAFLSWTTKSLQEDWPCYIILIKRKMLYNICSTCRNRSNQWKKFKKSSDFHGKIRFQSRFTIRWELEDKNFLKIDIICLDDSVKYRIMAIKTNENFIPFSNNVTFWKPRGMWLLLNWYQASVGQNQMSRPRGRFTRSKARQWG